MGRKLQAFLVAGLAALLLLAGAAPAMAGEYVHRETWLTFPDSIAGMRKIRVHKFPETKFGVGIGYAAQAGIAKADVYIYDLGLFSISADCNSPELAKEFERTDATMRRYAAKKGYQGYTSTGKSRINYGSGPTKGCALETRYQFHMPDRPDRQMRTFAFITAKRNRFVKLRFTMAAPLGPKRPKLYHDFISGLVAILTKD